MTSAEFAAKYRVLKTITERGARSQIAQETALGRMVMLHHLDVGTTVERQRFVTRLRSLTPDAAAKIFDVVTVDGTQVIVTHFLATFTDLPSWIEQHEIAGDATMLIEAIPRPQPAAPSPPPAVQPPAPPPPPPPAAVRPSAAPAPPAAPPAGGFTSIFGAAPNPPAPGAAPPIQVTPPRPVASPPTAAPTAPPPVASTPPAPPTAQKKSGSFTEMFGAPKPPATGAAGAW